MALSILVIAVVTTAIAALIAGMLIILRERRNERNNNKTNLRVKQEREEFKSSPKVTKSKAPHKDKFRGVKKKKKKFKLTKNE